MDSHAPLHCILHERPGSQQKNEADVQSEQDCVREQEPIGYQ